MQYYELIISNLTEEKSEILVAVLNNAGYIGFEEEPGLLKGYISDTDYDPDAISKLVHKHGLILKTSIVEEKNWNEIWETSFEPVTIFFPDSNLSFVHLRAHFHPEFSGAKYNIEITPKMSFGTGHHETTGLMIEEMSLLNFKDKAVIDFGTGTGVLAILAEKLGASKVWALDNDDWSIANGKENILKNDCSKIIILNAQAIPGDLRAHIILANINLNVIIHHLKEILHVTKPGGTFVFSGILRGDVDLLLEKFTQLQIKVVNIRYKNHWALIRAKI